MKSENRRNNTMSKRQPTPAHRGSKQPRTPKNTGGEQPVKPAGEPELPLLPVGVHDVAVLRSIIGSYLTYLRRGTSHPPECQRLIQLLQAVYFRLVGMPGSATEVLLLLSVAEVHAVNAAMLGFVAFVRRTVSRSWERDDTLQAVELLRQ